MVDEAVWPQTVKALDTDSVNQARETLRALLSQPSVDAHSVAASLARLMMDLKSEAGKVAALDVLGPYAQDAPECLELALHLSRSSDASTRLRAIHFLSRLPNTKVARDRVIELITDPEVNTRNAALGAVQQMEIPPETTDAAASLQVIPDDDHREEAFRLLDQLEKAIHVVQDLGLSEGQNDIVEEIILPKIKELRMLFGASPDTRERVAEERKRSLINLSALIHSGQALALTTSTIANADKAAQNVKASAEALFPYLQMIAGWL